MKKLFLIFALGANVFANAQGWVGNSTTNSLFSVNSALGLTPVNVGIGTNSPTVPLDVNGRVRIVGSPWVGGITTTGSALNINGGSYNQMNISHNNNLGLLIGYSDGSLTNNYHGLNSAAMINVNNAPLHLGTSNLSRLTILGNGNTGIGTLAPTDQLHTNLGVRFEGLTRLDTPSRVIVQDNNGRLYWRPLSLFGGGNANSWNLLGNNNAVNPGVAANQNYLGTSTNHRLVFATGGVNAGGNQTGAQERMTIQNSTGFIGIGTTNPQFRMHVIENTPWDQNTNTAPIWCENTLTGAGTTSVNQVGKVSVFGSININTTGNLQMSPRGVISGLVGRVLKSGTGNVTTQISGVSSNIGVTGSGNITDLVSLRANSPEIFPAGNAYTGTITNFYGLRIEDCNIGGGNVISQITNRYGIFQAGAGERNFFAGNVGIGTQTPTQRLTVSNGTTIGTYTTTGWIHSSDKRLKENISEIESPLDIINKLNGQYYTWKGNREAGRQIGFIAQEVLKVLPEVVVGIEGDIEKGQTLGMAYQNIVPVLVEGIKELNAKVEKQNNAVVENEELKAKIAVMEEKFALLEKTITQLCESGCEGLKKAGSSSDADVLYQSIPNPTDSEALINYSLSREYIDASITISSQDGKQLMTVKLEAKKGAGSIKINVGDLANGTYLYTLVAGERVIDTKRLQIVK
jgi:hypothetical protein